MSDELKYSLEKLNNAVKRLDHGVKQAKDNLDRDGVIQRFEFTFELLWKVIRLFLLEVRYYYKIAKRITEGSI
jgi:hypothetical protein